MINAFLVKAAAIVTALLVSAGLVAPASLGSAVPSTPALIDTYLAANITSSATSLTLANGTTRSGSSLSGFMCFVLDVNTPTVEYVCGTASSTSVTGLSRGVDPLNPNSTSSALAYAHRRFASIQVADYPAIQYMQRKLNGTDSFDSVLKYTSSSVTNATVGADPGNIASVGFVASTSFSGTVDASEIQKGIVEAATIAETAAGTASGSTSALLFAQNKYHNATSTATTTVPVTRANGTLDPNFIDQTGAYAFTNITRLSVNTATSSATSTDQFNLLPAGLIAPYISTTTPAGWLLADGTEYSTSTYPRLFTAIAYTFGGATSTFKVPNLSGRFIAGPSSTLSTTIGTTGGSTSSSISVNSTVASGQGTGGGGSGFAMYPGGTGTSLNSTGTAAIVPPYMVLQYIIKY